MIYSAAGLLAVMDVSAHIGSDGSQLFLYSCFNDPVEVLPGAMFELEGLGRLARYSGPSGQLWYLVCTHYNYRFD